MKEGTATHSKEAYFAFLLCLTATPNQEYGILMGKRNNLSIDAYLQSAFLLSCSVLPS